MTHERMHQLLKAALPTDELRTQFRDNTYFRALVTSRLDALVYELPILASMSRLATEGMNNATERIKFEPLRTEMSAQQFEDMFGFKLAPGFRGSVDDLIAHPPEEPKA